MQEQCLFKRKPKLKPETKSRHTTFGLFKRCCMRIALLLLRWGPLACFCLGLCLQHCRLHLDDIIPKPKNAHSQILINNNLCVNNAPSRRDDTRKNASRNHTSTNTIQWMHISSTRGHLVHFDNTFPPTACRGFSMRFLVR